MISRSYIFSCIFSLLISFPTCIAYPTTPPPSTLPQANNIIRSPECGFIGNNDIIGIGIRLGIYSQTIAVWIANYFLLSQAQVLRDSVTIFSVAILVVIFLFAANPSQNHAVEALILLQVLAWSCIMGVRAKSSWTKNGVRHSSGRIIVNELLNFCSLGLHVWFWWRGLDQLLETPCGTFAMFVVKVDMYGWLRTLMKVLSVFTLCATVYWAFLDSTKVWMFRVLGGAEEKFVAAVKRWEEEEKVRRGSVRGSSHASRDAAGSNSSGITDHRTEIPHTDTGDLDFDRQQTLVNLPMRPIPNPPSPPMPTQPSSPNTPRSNGPRSPTRSTDEHRFLEDIYRAELFIQHCISQSPHSRRNRQKPTLSTLAKEILGLVPSPPEHNTHHEPPPSFLEVHLAATKALLTLSLPAQTLLLYTHLRHAQLLDPVTTPYQLHASLAYPRDTLPSSSALAIASSLQLQRKPTKVWLGWYFCLLDLVIHVLVILQLELTIVWNEVQGVASLDSVGQLVPFIIGVVGLGLVGARLGQTWVARMGKGERWAIFGEGVLEVGRQEEGKEGGAVEGYRRWKEVYGARMKEEERLGVNGGG